MEFIRLHGAQRPGKKPYALYQITHSLLPGTSAYLLAAPNSKRKLFVKKDTKKVLLQDNKAYWPESPEGSPILHVRHSQTLVAFIQLEASPLITVPEHAIFWANEIEELESLVRQSLNLGNDRIQFASFQVSEQSGVFLRIESPSFFLLQQILDDHPAIRVVIPQGNDVYVQAGYQHPLKQLWEHPDRERTPQLTLFYEQEIYRLSPPDWKDGYQLTELNLDFSLADELLPHDGSVSKFQVPVKLATTGTPAKSEIWLLSEQGRAQLESLLQLLDEEALRPFQLAAHQTDSREYQIIREKRANQKSKHLELDGTGYYPFQGLANFFLPCGHTLLPPLRRDLYKSLFALEPGIITLLVPHPDGSHLTLRIPERSFQPLETLIDYIVTGNRETLEQEFSKCIFNFEHFAQAPSRPDIAKEKSEKKKNTSLSSNQPSGDNQPAQQTPDAEKLEWQSPEEASSLNTIDESQLPDAQRRELELERLLISKGQTAEIWNELADLKFRLGKPEESSIAALEALWLTDIGSPREESLFNLLQESHSQENSQLSQLLQYYLTPKEKASDSWIAEFGSALEDSPELRIKESWLFWGAILRLNKDQRKEVQLKETIQESIAHEGLSLSETPPFIRSRIFLDSRMGETDEQGSNKTLVNLLTTTEHLEGLTSGNLRRLALAIAARTFAQIGDAARALSQLKKTAKAPSDILAWVELYSCQTLQKLDPRQHKKLKASLDKRLKKAHPDLIAGLSESQDLYDRYERIDNPASFLSQENRSRLYPKGSSHQANPLYEICVHLENTISDGDERAALKILDEMMSLPDSAAYNDEVKAPQFVGILVDGLAKYRWSEKGAPLLLTFKSFAKKLPKLVDSSNPFYRILLHTSLADGLALSELPEKAKEQVQSGCDQLSKIHTELDLIDASAALLTSLEQLPLGARFSGLKSVIEGIARLGNSPFLSNPRLLTTVTRLIEQVLQAAISKDKLSLNHFKNYQLQDEFLVLKRIHSESFTKHNHGRTPSR